MTINGKQDGFTLADFRACAATAGLKRGRAEVILDEVRAAVARWLEYAQQAGVRASQRDPIRSALRLEFPRRDARPQARP
jgi:serine/threonine-protein kinase HipA